MQLENMIQAGSVFWIVAPHADDEALGCGGLMSVARRMQAKVYVLFVTLSGYVPLDAGQVSSHNERRAEVNAAMACAGVDGHDILYDNGRHHCYLDTVPLKEMLDWLESESVYSFCKVQPNVLLVPSGWHSHQDHRQVSEAVSALFRVNPLHNHVNRVILEYEIPGMGMPGIRPFEPNMFVELSTEDLEQKCRHFENYGSQLAPAPHPRSSHAIRALAAHRGVEAGYDYAEAFRLLRACVGRQEYPSLD